MSRHTLLLLSLNGVRKCVLQQKCVLRIPLLASEKKQKPSPSSSLFDTDDEDF